MEKIDLTKCNNCRIKVRARYYDGEEYAATGRIFTMRDGAVFVESDNEEGDIELFCDGKISDEIVDFEIVPRDPETYRDWQVGDTIEYGDNYSTGRIIFRGGDLVAADIEGTCNCYTCDELFNEEYRLVLTDIEQQIIEERKKAEWEPQDGDVCYAELISDWVFIKKDGEFLTENYAALKLNDGYTNFDNPSRINNDAFVKMIRIATEEERQKLFDAMANEGKRWNAEKKVVEDIPKPHEFKKGEPVLVRDDNESLWILGSFIQFIPTTCFHVTNGVRPSHWKQCLPYNERTMHLLGTAEDYKEE